MAAIIHMSDDHHTEGRAAAWHYVEDETLDTERMAAALEAERRAQYAALADLNR